MNFSARQLEIISSQVNAINPAVIAVCDGFSYRQIPDYRAYFQCHVRGNKKPLLIIETDPDMGIHPTIRWGIEIMGFKVKRVAHIQRDDEGGCALSVNLWLVENKPKPKPGKSCLNCLLGEFSQEIDSGLYSYSGQCCHFESGIHEQVVDIVEVGDENLSVVEKMFEKVGQQCPMWEPGKHD